MDGNGWVEIFDAATHTKTWPKSAADVERIAASYDPVFHEAPLKYDHGTESGPALGWIAGLKASGTKLLARLKDVSNDFREALRSGRYKKFSAEIYPDLQGRGPYLRALAVLGAAVPEVKGLAPLPAGYFAEHDRAGGGILKIDTTLYFGSEQRSMNSVYSFSERTKPADVLALSEEARQTFAQFEREAFAEIAQVLAQDKKISYSAALIMTERLGRRPAARARVLRFREGGCEALDPGRKFLAAAATGYARAKGVSYHDAALAVARDPRLLKFGENEGNAEFQREFRVFAEQALANEEAAEQEAEAERLEKSGDAFTAAIMADKRKILLEAKRRWNEARKGNENSTVSLSWFIGQVADDFLAEKNPLQSQKLYDEELLDHAEQLALTKRIPLSAAVSQIKKESSMKLANPVQAGSSFMR